MPTSQPLPTVLSESRLLPRICKLCSTTALDCRGCWYGIAFKAISFLAWNLVYKDRLRHCTDPLKLFSLIAGVIWTCCITHDFLNLVYHIGDGYSCNGSRTPHSKECIFIMHLDSSTGNRVYVSSLKDYRVINNSSLHKFSQPLSHGLPCIFVPMGS